MQLVDSFISAHPQKCAHFFITSFAIVSNLYLLILLLWNLRVFQKWLVGFFSALFHSWL